MALKKVFSFDREKVAHLLEKEMDRQGWQATALSRKANLHEHAVYHFLNKKTRNVEKLDAIATVLGKDVSYFLTGEDNPVNSASFQSEALPYNGELLREAMKIVEEILLEQDIPLNKELVSNLADSVYKYSIKKDKNGKINKDIALGIISYAVDNNLVTKN